MTEQKRHLLIVEDEAPLRQAIAEQLTDHGYHVAQADSGEAAVARLADFAFDVIITDLRLPGIDGSSVVEAAVERYPDIVAIVITGYGTFKDAVYVFDDMYKDKHALTRLAQEYLREHNWTYPNGAKAPFGNDLAEAVQKLE